MGKRRSGSTGSASSRRRKQHQQRRKTAPADVLKERLLRDALLLETSSEEIRKDLRKLALSDGGLLNKRQEAWIVLLSLDEEKKKLPKTTFTTALPEKLAHQIELDVKRSYGHLSGDGEKPRMVLGNFLLDYFARNYPKLHYYQGFHDVAIVVLEVFENQPRDVQFAALERLSYHTVFVDAHDADFGKVRSLLDAAQDLVGMVDEELGLRANEFPYWGVSMLVCCFAHDVAVGQVKQRLFDAMIASPPYFPLYMVSALAFLPTVREQIMQEDANPHAILRKTAREINTLKQADELVRIATQLEQRVQGESLVRHCEHKYQLSRDSILFKTPCVLFEEWIPPVTPPPPPQKRDELQRRKILLLLLSLAVGALAYWMKRRWF